MSFFVSRLDPTGRDIFTNFSGVVFAGFPFLDLTEIMSVLEIRVCFYYNGAEY
jgi:hypothetical protein